MGQRAPSSGISLTARDAALVKAMLNRGDRQHDIAAWFGVNGGRIGEIASRQSFASVQPESAANLPPPGPYPSGKDSMIALGALIAARDAIDEAVKSLQKRM